MKLKYLLLASLPMISYCHKVLSENTNDYSDGKHLIHRAAYLGKLSSIKKLVQNGYDPCKLDGDNIAPLAVAQKRQHADIVDYLLSLQNSESSAEHEIACGLCNEPCLEQMQLSCCNQWVHQGCLLKRVSETGQASCPFCS